jgi:hypothetical protein
MDCAVIEPELMPGEGGAWSLEIWCDILTKSQASLKYFNLIGRGLIFCTNTAITWNDLNTPQKCLNKESLFSGKDTKHTSPEYE